jgi:hypothetical protein
LAVVDDDREPERAGRCIDTERVRRPRRIRVHSLLEEQVTTTEPTGHTAPPRLARRTHVAIALAVIIGLIAVAAWQAPRLLRDTPGDEIAVTNETNAEQVVRSANGRAFASTIDGGTTRIDELEPTRTTLGTLPGEYTLRIANRDGTQLALADPLADGADIYQPGPKAVTHLVTFDTATGATRPYDIPRNVEPEAFGVGAPLLFVIDHRPAIQPDHYRVGYIDLLSGEFLELFGPNKTPLDIDMTGTARQQVPSASGDQLYTLYVHHEHDAAHDAHDPAGLPTAAFVHVLDLRAAWAYCVDLPAFGHGPLETAAIALGEDGRQLFVADTRTGKLATVATDQLTAERLAAGSPPVAFVDLPADVARDATITLETSDAGVVVRSANESWTYDTAARSWR